jgi:epoxyqueuosine reductase
MIDARKCISYHTIENKGEIPEPIIDKLNGQIFGCDICQDVCPWNKKIKPNQSNDFKPIAGLLEMKREDWMELSRETYTKTFRHTAFERAGYDRIKRNISYLKEEF